MPDKFDPRFHQAAFKKYTTEYDLIDDIWGGLARQQDLMKYLPSRTMESNKSYKLRLDTTSLPKIYRDSIEKGAGRLGKATLSEDAPEIIKNISRNLNLNRKTLETLTYAVFMHLLKYANVVGLIDFDKKEGRAFMELVPLPSVRNVVYSDGVLQRLSFETVELEPDGYDAKAVTQVREYLPEELNIYRVNEQDEAVAAAPVPLVDASGAPRAAVYAVWFSIDPSADPWTPLAPPQINLAKGCIKQMLKVSELDRAESICNMQVLKRYHPPGTDPNAKPEPLVWDPERAIEIPHGGEVKIDEPQGTAIAITHQRNQDREASLKESVDAYLNEKVMRTDYQAGLMDQQEVTRLELIASGIQQGFQEAFRYIMQLSDRNFNAENDDPGSLILSSTEDNVVSDEEMSQLAEQYRVGIISLPQANPIAVKYLRQRHPDVEIPDGAVVVPNQVIEG